MKVTINDYEAYETEVCDDCIDYYSKWTPGGYFFGVATDPETDEPVEPHFGKNDCPSCGYELAGNRWRGTMLIRTTTVKEG